MRDCAVDKAEIEAQLKLLKDNSAELGALELVGLQVKELKESTATKAELDALHATVKKLKTTTINGFGVFKTQFRSLVSSYEGKATQEASKASGAPQEPQKEPPEESKEEQN